LAPRGAKDPGRPKLNGCASGIRSNPSPGSQDRDAQGPDDFKEYPLCTGCADPVSSQQDWAIGMVEHIDKLADFRSI